MKRPAGDQGSVLLLVLGLTVVLAGLVAVVTDVSVLLLAQRGVASAADGAAVAGAQQLDEGAFYDAGLGSAVPLDRERVGATVAGYARQVTPRTRLVGEVLSDGTTVRVQASREVTLPFSGALGTSAATVRSVASARAPVVG